MTSRLLTTEQYAAHQAKYGRVRLRDVNTPIVTRHGVPGKPAAAKKRRAHTDYNEMLAEHLRMVHWNERVPAPAWVREYRFDAKRKWRIDIAFPAIKLAVEIDGGAHTIRARWKASFEREQALFFAGFRLLKVSPEQVRDGTAVKLIERALG